MLINIVTPTIRFENLRDVQASIIKHTKWVRNLIPIWWVMYDKGLEIDYIKKYVDTKEPLITIFCEMPYYAEDKFGYHKRNHFLNLCETPGYIFWLDDDNAIHPHQFCNFGDLGKTFFIDQEDKRGIIRIPHTNPIEVGGIDIASVIQRREDLGDLRFNDSYTADGEMFKKLYVEMGIPIIRTDMMKSYYNKLR